MLKMPDEEENADSVDQKPQTTSNLLSNSLQQTKKLQVSSANTQKNGVSSLEDYYKNYCYVCQFCTRRYSSITGLNYHLSSFNHKNPPPNYDPHRISKRGRPRGYRPKAHYNTSRMQAETYHIQQDDYTSRSGRRVSRPRGVYGQQQLKNQNLKKLTYAESQRLVEIEQNNHYYRVSVEETLCVLKEESDPSSTHPKNDIKRPDTIPRHEFTVSDPYNLPKTDDNRVLSRDTYVQPLERLENNDETIEYEIDEEDVAWLKIMSETSEPISSEIFEYIMDKLEKESEFRVKNADGTSPDFIDDDVVCAVCLDGDCSNTNLIVFCDICNMAVHQDCYGLPYVPEGQWLCRRCSHAPSKEIDCVLCPVKSGVFKQTVNGVWCHIICAIMIPGAKFVNAVFLEPIDIGDISPTRFNVRCKLCNETKGAVIQCVQPQCTASFHPSCAQASGLLYVERSEISGSEDGVLSQFNHRYLSFCPKHYPVHKDQPGGSTLKAKKVVPSRTSRSPATIHVPVVSDDLLNRLANELDKPNSLEFVLQIKRYWQIKRYLRSGVPLLRRRSFIPKNPASNFRVSDKQLSTLDSPSETVSKLEQLKRYLKGFIGALELVQHRERLKRKRSFCERRLHQSVFGFEDFMEKLVGEIKVAFKKAGEKVSLNNNTALFNTFRAHFQMLNLTSIDDFADFLNRVFEINYKDQHNVKFLVKANQVVKTSVLGIECIPDESPIKKKITSNSSGFLSQSFEIIPSNIDTDVLVVNLTAGLSDDDISDYCALNDIPTVGSLVWAHLGKIKHFPAHVITIEPIEIDEQLAKNTPVVNIDVTFCDKDKSWKRVPNTQVALLGVSASVDKARIIQVLMSKSYNRTVKKDFLDTYKRVRDASLLNTDQTEATQETKAGS